jgi:hypothetical protein
MNDIQKSKIKHLALSLAIITIFGIGLYLRLKPVILRPVIFDEAYTITYLIKYDKVLDIINADPSVPPLHYLLIKLMSKISINIIWLRAPSLIFAFFGLILTYKIAKKFSQKIAIFVLIMMSVSAYQITYTWQAYVYGQLFFFGMCALYLFFELFTEENVKKAKLKGLIICLASVLAFFTHYGFIWTIGGFSIIVLKKIIDAKFNFKKIHKQHKILIFSVIATNLLLLSYAPIFINNFQRATLNIYWFKSISIFTLGESIVNLLGFYDQFQWTNFLSSHFTQSIITILFLFIIFFLLKLKDKKINILIVITLSNLLFPIILSFIMGQSIHAERAIIVASSTLTIIVAIFSNQILRKKFNYIFLTIFFICLLICMENINRTKYLISQEQDISKYYVDWIRKNIDYINKDYPIFIYNSLRPFAYSEDIANSNYYIFDYYWKGYDQKPPLYEYKKIYLEREIYENRFYLLLMNNIDDEISDKICLNKKTIPLRIYDEEVSKLFDMRFQDSLDLHIYECNLRI